MISIINYLLSLSLCMKRRFRAMGAQPEAGRPEQLRPFTCVRSVGSCHFGRVYDASPNGGGHRIRRVDGDDDKLFYAPRIKGCKEFISR